MMSTQSSPVQLLQIGQIALRVLDLDRAVAFYGTTLGLRLLFRVPNLAFFDCNGVRLMLSVPENPKFDHPASIIYYKVADIQATCATLAARGVKIESQPHLIAGMDDHDLWMAFIRDSEENLLGLMNEAPHSLALESTASTVGSRAP